MKKIFGWAVSWLLYIIGHATSLTFRWDDVASKTYPYYSWFMIRSYAVQEWCGHGPWNECEYN